MTGFRSPWTCLASMAVLAGLLVAPGPLEAASGPPEVVTTSQLPRIYGDSAGIRLGSGHLVADLNGDGVEDLVLASVSPVKLWVFFSPFEEQGWDVAPGQLIESVAAADATITLGGAGGERVTLAAGDVVGADGILDLVVGTPEEDVFGGMTQETLFDGAVRVLAGPFEPGDDLHDGDVDYSFFPRQSASADGGRLGAMLLVEDLDGDGSDDLVIGQPDYAEFFLLTRYNIGQVMVLRGETAQEVWSSSSQVVPYVEDGLGGTLPSVDVLLVGSLLPSLRQVGESALSTLESENGGRALLLAGQGEAWVVTDILSAPADPGWVPLNHPEVTEIRNLPSEHLQGSFGLPPGARVGRVESGRFAGHWLGAPDGSGSVFHGDLYPDWSGASPLQDSVFSLVGDPVAQGLFGYDFASGDLNRDGLPDLAVVAPSWDLGVTDVFSEQPNSAGAVYVLSGCDGAPIGDNDVCVDSVDAHYIVSLSAALRIEGSVEEEWGELNLDPLSRAPVRVTILSDRLLIIVPAYTHPSLGGSTGAVFIWKLGFDEDHDGFWTAGAGPVDCDDAAPSVYPGALEYCNGVDDDCDGSLAEGEVDQDGDGSPTCAEDFEPAPVEDSIDCDDNNNMLYPGGMEMCDALDNDCDQQLAPGEVDDDGDGSPRCDPQLWPDFPQSAGDCDDANPMTYPGSAEHCDGLDNDCDNELASDESDIDQDGWVACSPWTGLDDRIRGAGDCDDSDAGLAPGQSELCDGVDQDCDGQIDEGYDADGDGFTSHVPDAGSAGSEASSPASCTGEPVDCDDNDPLVYPGAYEDGRDGIDHDCDGATNWPGGWSCSQAPREGRDTSLMLVLSLLVLGVHGRRRKTTSREKR